MQRGLASFDIFVIVSELQALQGCYLEKIYQLSYDEILLRVQQSTTHQKEQIFIRNGALLCLTKKEYTVPEKPSVFAMTLRKYLLNGKISSITQHEFDRIIKITIGRKEGDYTLVCELFSKGNIILVNPEGRIIRPLIKQEWAARLIKSGEMYIPPPSQTHPFHITKQEFHETLKSSSKGLIRVLATTLNLSGFYAEELCVRAGINKNIKASEIPEEIRKKIYDELQSFLAVFSEKKIQPVLVKKDGAIVDILPLPFQSYQGAEFEKTKSFSAGLEPFINVRREEKPQQEKHQQRIEKLHRQLAQQQDLITGFQKSSQQKKIEGDLLYFNFQQCDALLKEIAQMLKQKEKTDAINAIRHHRLVKQFDPTANELRVFLPDGKGNHIEVVLDFRKSAAENAQMMYQESKKYQEKIKGAQEAVSVTDHELQTLKQTPSVEKEKETSHQKQWWFQKYRWFISTEGNIIVAGRDASSNDQVVKKYLSEGDRYAHADIHGAPSCVIKSKGPNDEKLPISENTLQEACMFAASYSRAWNQFAEAQAYWVLPEQVSKTPQSGEYVPKGGFIIRGKRNYVRCPLEVAVGLISIGDDEILMGGPVSSVSTKTPRYAILVPGSTKKSTIAQQLSKIFHVSTDAVEKTLPPGNLTVVKTIGFELPEEK